MSRQLPPLTHRAEVAAASRRAYEDEQKHLAEEREKAARQAAQENAVRAAQKKLVDQKAAQKATEAAIAKLADEAKTLIASGLPKQNNASGLHALKRLEAIAAEVEKLKRGSK